MMKHAYYQENDFAEKFLEKLQEKVEQETSANPYLKSLAAQKSKKLHNTQTLNNKESLADLKENSKVSKSRSPDKTNNVNNHNVSKSTSPPKDKEKKPSPKQPPPQQQQHQHYPALVAKGNHSESNGSPKKSKGHHLHQCLEDKNNNHNLTQLKNQTNSKTTSLNGHSSEKLASRADNKQQTRSPNHSPDFKSSSRTPLDISINQPGKNLPEINSSVIINR